MMRYMHNTKEKRDAFSKAPPTNILNNPNNVSCNLSKYQPKHYHQLQGMGICAPIDNDQDGESKEYFIS